MFPAVSAVCAVGALVLCRGCLGHVPIWWLVLMIPATMSADALTRRRS